MICGSKWKTCDCPWFNQDAVDNDRLEHMQIPVDLEPDPIAMMADRFEPSPQSLRNFRPGGEPGVVHVATIRSRPQSYEEEVYVRRRHEQQDEDSHRRPPHPFGGFEEVDDHSGDKAHRRHRYDDRYRDDMGDEIDAMPHPMVSVPDPYMHDEYLRGQSGLAAPTPPPPPPPQQQHLPSDRVNSGTDYVSGVNRARGVRASSLERRLAERFDSGLRKSPMRKTAPPPLSQHAPTLSPPHTMPMAPMPPPAAPMPVPVLRRHTMEEDLYNNARSTRPSERVVPGRVRHDYESEAAVHAPLSRRRRNHSTHSTPRNHHHRHQERQSRLLPAQETPEPPKTSALAGLAGTGKGMNRVSEWRTHVRPGSPDEEASTISI